MLPGPDLIKKCPNCGKLAKQSTVASGNNFGAKYWTDGWFFAPMLPQTPQLVDCPHCKNTGWQSDFDEVDRSPAGAQVIFLMQDALEDGIPLGKSAKEKLEKREQYKQLPHLEETSAEGIERFLASTDLQPNQEITARILLWRKWNDTRRSEPEQRALTTEELKNLIRLNQLLENTNNQNYILRAEISRQLKQFERAQLLLDLVPDDKAVLFKSRIAELVSQHDHYLRRVS